MPLNATSYLEEHGWEGKGVALDGRQGRGLKKPLALPMKRNQRGLGKDRDRATEWWDCLFETSAKSINIQVGAAVQSSATDNTSGAASALSSKKGKEKQDPLEEVVAAKLNNAKVSLASQAKRDYARKMLMSGFVRAGKASMINTAETELERILLEQQQEEAKQKKTVKTASVVSESTKEERRRAREERRKRKEEKRLKREAKEAKKADKESKRTKKRKQDEEEKAKDKDRKESKRAKKSLPRPV